MEKFSKGLHSCPPHYGYLIKRSQICIVQNTWQASESTPALLCVSKKVVLLPEYRKVGIRLHFASRSALFVSAFERLKSSFVYTDV